MLIIIISIWKWGFQIRGEQQPYWEPICFCTKYIYFIIAYGKTKIPTKFVRQNPVIQK